MPKIKLAGQRLQSQSLGGISPIKLQPGNLPSGPSGSGLRAPQINISAGNTQFTPLPVPDIVLGNEWQAASDFSGVVVTETFKFQERQAQLDADILVTNYERQQQQKWLGSDDGQGNVTKGQMSLKGKEAIDSHGGYVGSVDKDFQDSLMGAPESVRQKAALRMYGVRDTYLTRAANKRVKELDFAEQEAMLARHEQIYKEIEVDPDRGWAQMQNLAGDPRVDQATKIDMMSKAGVYTTEKIYQNAIKAGASEEVAFQDSLDWFEVNRDTMPEVAENKVASALQQQGAAIDKAAEGKAKKAEAKYQSIIEAQGSGNIYKGMVGGVETMSSELPAYFEIVKDAYRNDPHKIRGVMTKQYKDSFRGLMYNKGYEYAVQAFENMKVVGSDPENPVQFGMPGMMTDLQVFMDSTLLTESTNRDAYASTKRKRATTIAMIQAPDIATLDQNMNALLTNESATAEEIKSAEGTYNSRRKEMEGSISEGTKMIQDANYMQFFAEAENGMTPEFEEGLAKAFSDGNIRSDQYETLYKRSQTFSQNKVTPEYKQLKTDVKSLIDLEEMYYDPETRKVGFWNMLAPKEQENIKERQEQLGKSDKVMKSLAVSSLMSEAERWRKRTGGEFDQFMSEYFSQQPEIKRGVVNNLVRKMHNANVGWGPGRIAGAQWLEVATGPKKEAVTYEGYGTEPVRDISAMEVPPAEILNASGVSLQEAQAAAAGTTVGDVQEQKIAEFAVSTIPPKRKQLYAEKDTNWLLALEMVREQKKFVDDYSMQEIEDIVKVTLTTPEFEEWRNSKLKSQ